MKELNRRSFAKRIGLGLAASALPLNSYSFIGNDTNTRKKLGIALVGLGSYSTYQLAPALQETEHCYLTGVVTGTKSKEQDWKDTYVITDDCIYDYDNFDSIINNSKIDIVYVVLPNSMHAEFCIRAANAGKHVICEKPMAVNVVECDAIIAACKKNNVKLSVGYRMQSDPYTNEIKKYVKEKSFGDISFVSSDAAYISKGNPGQWRLTKPLWTKVP